MPNFTTDSRFHYISFITGPSHNLLGLELGKDTQGKIELIKKPCIGDCDHGMINEAQLLIAIQDGVKKANSEKNAQYSIKSVVYVENDSPRYDIYKHCAELIVKRLYEGGNFAVVLNKEENSV